MRLTIFQKGLILVAVPFLFQSISAWLIADAIHRQNQAQEWASHSKDVQNQVQLVLNLLLEAESALRGYLLTANPAAVTRFNTATGEATSILDRFQSLVTDNPVQVKRAARIAEQARALIEKQAGVLKLAQDQQPVDALKALQQLQEKELMILLRKDIDAFQHEEARLERERVDLERGSQQRLNGIVIGSGVLTVAMTMALSLVFFKGIKRRVQMLTDNVQRLAQSKPLTEPVDGNDEIARIDQSFHEMARALEEAHAVEKRYMESLESKVRERTEELAKTNQELRHNNQENELFVYSVSHDLRSPLVNLQGFSKELAMTCKDLRRLLDQDGVPEAVRNRGHALVDKDVTESIHFISNGVTRLSGIIDALLRLSRAGRVDYQNQLVDVSGVVRRVVEASKISIAEKNADIQVQSLPATWGDSTALEQVFANLIGNALKYLDSQRPGVIEVGWTKTLVDGQRQEAYYVKDNGLGIDAAYQHKVFQAFQRVHPDVAPGEGMGLAIVRRIVERHHGRIWVESKPNEGSIFYVSLPGRRSAERTHEHRSDGDLVGGRR